MLLHGQHVTQNFCAISASALSVSVSSLLQAARPLLPLYFFQTMPDAFFAKSTRKRKRSTSREGPSTSKKPARSQGKQQFASGTKGKKPASKQSRARDEELSDETYDEDDHGDVDDMDLRAPDVDPNAYESAEEDEDETPAEKRLRLAKLYLDGVKQGLGLGKSCAASLSE